VGNSQADMRTSVENEWLCSKIMTAFGLPIAHCDIATFEDQKALVVERFDRTPSRDGSWILRLPQVAEPLHVDLQEGR
jgi:serine/threonine-protein kinase HipA